MEKMELKQSNLTLQWKDLFDSDDTGSARNVQLQTRIQELQDYFDSERNSLLTRNRDIEDREKELEAKVVNFNLEMESKARELQEIQSLAEEKGKEVEFKTIKLGLIQKSMADSCNTLESKEEVIRAMEKRTRLVEAKRRELEELVEKLEFRRKQVESKVEELGLIDGRVTECLNEVQLEGKQSDSHGRSLQGLSGGVEKKERQLEELAKELELERKQFDSVIRERQQHLDSQEKNLQEGSRGLEMKERQLEEQVKEFESKQKQFALAIHERQKNLDFQEMMLKVGSQGLELKGRQLEEEAKELELKRKQFDSMTEEHGKRLSSQEKSLQERSHGLEMRERRLEEHAKEFKLKHTQFDSMIQGCQQHLGSQENILQEGSEGLGMKETKFEEPAKDVELKRKQFDLLIQERECSHGLQMKERQLENQVKQFEMNQIVFSSMIQKHQQHLDSREKLLQECSHGLLMKERQFEEQVKEYESKQKQFYSTTQECQQHLDSQAKLLRELSLGLEMRERQLQEHVKELESKQKQFDSIQKSTEEHIRKLKFKEKTNVHTEVDSDQQLVSTPATIITGDGRGLQLLVNNHLKRIGLVGNEISAAFQASSDPAKLVLDAMQGFYPSNSAVDNTGSDFDLRVTRRSCILLLQELKIFSPQISPQVREEAMNLAADWKAKMTMASENGLEVLGFLRLVTVYEITNVYDSKELQSLLAIVAQHEQATQLCQALGVTNKTPTRNIISFPIKIQEPETSSVRNVVTSSQNPQLRATKDVRNLQGFPNEHSNGKESMQNEMFVPLQMSLYPENLTLELIKSYFGQCWGKEDVGFGAAVMDHTISLLNDLAKVKPHIGPDLKQDANELAVQWKAKLREDSENSLEILGFLQFITTYGLLSTFNRGEIVKLFGMFYPEKMALESCQTRGFADKIPGIIHDLRSKIQPVELRKCKRLRPE